MGHFQSTIGKSTHISVSDIIINVFVLRANVQVCLGEEVSTSQLLTKGMTDGAAQIYTDQV